MTVNVVNNVQNHSNCKPVYVKQLPDCKITTYQLEANQQQKLYSSVMSTILPGIHLFLDDNTTKASKRKKTLFELFDIACIGLMFYPIFSKSKMNLKKSILFFAGTIGAMAGALWSGHDAYKNTKGNKINVIQDNDGQIINIYNIKQGSFSYKTK